MKRGETPPGEIRFIFTNNLKFVKLKVFTGFTGCFSDARGNG